MKQTEQTEQKANRQYFNDAQMYLSSMMARDEIAVCGRGWGKGALQAVRAQYCFQHMPGSFGGFVSPSVKRCLTNILPSLLIHLERWGFKRDIHYIVGKKPWKNLHWKSPILSPENWENTISFYNGSVINIISQDRTGTSNSMSLDYVIIDEAKFVDFEQLKNETFQANRGNKQYFGKCPLHHALTITSDMPVTKKGSWFLNYKNFMDPELVQTMEGIIFQIWKLRQKIKRNPDRSGVISQQIASYQKDLDFLRSKCVLYKEYSSLENLAILGEDYVQRAKRDLPPLTFATSIMCKRIGISTDGFYGGMREDVNEYTAPNQSVLNLQNLDKNNIPNDCRMDGDLIPVRPLIIAFDANNNINWLVAGQVGLDGKLRVVKSFFVKYERKIPELLDDFMAYYKYHKRKQVIFYYDSTFVGNNYALHNNDFHKEIENGLRRGQWNVRAIYIGKPMDHIAKNGLINRMFRGRANHMVLINKDNNTDLLISISSAGTYNGKKDKRGEKLVETEEDKLESRTDGSDAFDTLCIGVERFPVMSASFIMPNTYG